MGSRPPDRREDRVAGTDSPIWGTRELHASCLCLTADAVRRQQSPTIAKGPAMQASRVVRRFLLPALAVALAAVVLLLSPGAKSAEAAPRCDANYETPATVDTDRKTYFAANAKHTSGGGLGQWFKALDNDGFRDARGSDLSSQTYFDEAPKSLEFCIRSTSAGLYKLDAELRSPSNADGSFFVQLGEQAPFITDFTPTDRTNGATFDVSPRFLQGGGCDEAVCPYYFHLEQDEALTVRFYTHTPLSGIRSVVLTRTPSDLGLRYQSKSIVNVFPETDLSPAFLEEAGSTASFRFHRKDINGGTLFYNNVRDIHPLNGQRFAGVSLQKARDIHLGAVSDMPILDGPDHLSPGTLAFIGSADGVEIRNLEITFYAAGKNNGPISPMFKGASDSLGYDWRVVNNYIHSNGDAAIRLGNGMLVKENLIERNAKIGITTAGRNRIPVQGDRYGGGRISDFTISRNVIKGNGTAVPNDANDDTGFEHHEGGIKVTWTDRSEISNNWVIKNRGVGIYCDLFCDGTVIDGNTIADNGGTSNDRSGGGIFVELSRHVKITNNDICGVGQRDNRRFWGGIMVAESRNIKIEDNKISIVNFGDPRSLPGNPGDGSGTLIQLRNNVLGLSVNASGFVLDDRTSSSLRNITVRGNLLSSRGSADVGLGAYCQVATQDVNDKTWVGIARQKSVDIDQNTPEPTGITFSDNHYCADTPSDLANSELRFEWWSGGRVAFEQWNDRTEVTDRGFVDTETDICPTA